MGAIYQLLSQMSFWIGLTFAGVLLTSYLIAIRDIPVSIAYVAVTSLAMVGLVIIEASFHSAGLGLSKILGMSLVVAGVFLLTKGTL
jgi:multidrug transporter EmrE-like cation transporter